MKSNFLILLSLGFIVCFLLTASSVSGTLPSMLMPFDSENHDTAPFYWMNQSLINPVYPLPALSNAQVKFGAKSLFFDGTDKRIAYQANGRSLDLVGKDFTIDFWYYPLSLPGITDVNGAGSQIEQDLFQLINKDDRTKDLIFYTRSLSDFNTPGRLTLLQANSAVSPPTAIQLKSSRFEQMTLNQWNHVALMWKQGKGYAIAINGRISSSNGWYNLPDSPPLSIPYTNLYLNSPYFANSRPPHGYLDQFRVTIGEAIWGDTPQGGTFTPPTTPTAPYNYTIYHWDRSSDGTRSATGDYTLTAPSGGQVTQIELIGGGGGGVQTCAAFSCFVGGNGGGGGAYGNQTYALLSGAPYLIHVGKAGKGGSNGYSTDMTPGEETFIQQVGISSTKLFAGGGGAGYGGGGTYGGYGGAGGTSNALQAVAGQPGQVAPNYNGGAGGSSGSGAAGGTSAHITQTPGYSLELISGKRYGGGGAGGGGTNGGNGAEGLMILTYTTGSIAAPICGSNGCEVGETATSCPVDCSVTPPVSPPPIASCPLNQTLFKLYQKGNSHVANASNAEASVPICYPAIFGTSYLGANPHQCTGTNVLFNATSTYNAHISLPGYASPTYDAQYCYGDLSCTVRATASACTANERVVARFPDTSAGMSNLHVGNASFSAYSRVLCCAPSSPVSVFTNIQWTTPTGTPLSTASINQTVNVSVQTTRSTGTAITFTVTEEDGFIGDDFILTLQGTVVNGKATASFKLNDTLIAAGMNEDGGKLELDFTVEATQGGSTSPPALLKVGLVEGGTGYLLPGNITGIYHGKIYIAGTAGSPIIINHTFVRQNALRLNWTIAEDGFSTTQDSFAHTFSTPGQKTITLHVSNADGGHAELQLGVLVVPSSGEGGLMTFIDYPGYYQIVPTGRNPQTSFTLGANTSFALGQATSACGPFVCLGGVCPSATNNTDSCSSPPAVRQITGNTNTYSALTFTWELLQGGNWHLVSTGSGQFTRSITLGSSAYSSVLNDRQVRVTTNYTSGVTSLQSAFTRAFTLGQCLDNGHQFAVVDSRRQFVRLVSTVSGEGTTRAPFSRDACAGEDGARGTGDDCVPNGWQCGPNGAYIPIVNTSAPTPIFCDDYTPRGEAACNAARLAFPSTVTCIGQTQGASCVWENNKCGTRYTVTSFTGTTDTCTEFFDQSGACVEGLRDVTITATPTQAGAMPLCPAFTSACVPRADTLVCGRPAYELPFFGFWQMVIGGLGIVVLGLLRRQR